MNTFRVQRNACAEALALAALVLSFPALRWGVSVLGVQGAAGALLVKSVLQAALLLPVLGAFRAPDWNAPFLRETGRRIAPLAGGSTYSKTGPLFDRFLASAAALGQLSLLYLADQIYSAGHFLLGRMIATPLVPALAEKARGGEWDGFEALSRRALLRVLTATTVVLGCGALIGRPLLPLALEHGRFDPRSIDQLFWLLVALGGSWIGGATGQVLASSFYAHGDTLIPARVGVCGFTVGLLLKIVGFWRWGVIGLALASSAYLLLNAVVLHMLLRRKLRRLRAAGQVA